MEAYLFIAELFLDYLLQIDINTIDDQSLKDCINNYIALNGPFRPSENSNKIDMDKVANLVFQGGSVKGSFLNQINY